MTTSADLAAQQTAAQLERTRKLYGQLLQQIKPILATSVGAGVALRGGVGVYNLLQRNLAPKKHITPGVNVVDHPIYSREQEKESSNPVANWITGLTAENVQDLPWNIPAKVTAGIGGLYGGYKITDKLLDQRRKADLEARLKKVRMEYEEALRGSYKTAEKGTLAHDLDLFTEMMKSAGVLGSAAGAYITTAGAAALLSALAGYKRAKGTSRAKLLEDTEDEQLRKQTYQPVYINPVSA